MANGVIPDTAQPSVKRFLRRSTFHVQSRFLTTKPDASPYDEGMFVGK